MLEKHVCSSSRGAVKVQNLETAVNSGDAVSINAASTSLVKTTLVVTADHSPFGQTRIAQFVAKRQSTIAASLKWRLQSALSTVMKGWREWSAIEQRAEQAAANGSTAVLERLCTIVIGESAMPDASWLDDINPK